MASTNSLITIGSYISDFDLSRNSPTCTGSYTRGQRTGHKASSNAILLGTGSYTRAQEAGYSAGGSAIGGGVAPLSTGSHARAQEAGHKAGGDIIPLSVQEAGRKAGGNAGSGGDPANGSAGTGDAIRNDSVLSLVAAFTIISIVKNVK